MRDCSFNPSKYAIEVSYDGATKERYLEVKYRTQWFNTYCEEKGVVGFIDEHELRFVPELGMLIATVLIYMDKELVGKSVAGLPFQPEMAETMPTAVQSVFTTAKGRALANCGFGLGDADERAGETLPCDSGIKAGEVKETDVVVTPPKKRGRPKKVKDSDPVPPVETKPSKEEVIPAPQTQTQPQLPESEEYTPEDLEKALDVVIPMGVYQGKTFRQIYEEDHNEGAILFYATSFNSPDPEHQILKWAGKVIAKMRLSDK